MKHNLIIWGACPEDKNMAHLIKVFQKKLEKFETKVCIPAQHREMLDQELEFYKVVTDFDLDLMKPIKTSIPTSNLITDSNLYWTVSH